MSVHGANRLGTNSLLDLLVFGRAAGNHLVASHLAAQAHRPLPAHAADFTAARLARLDASTGGEYSQTIANDLRKTMQLHAGVFRTQASMDEGVGKVQAIAERGWSMHLADKSNVFNTARVEALEVDNLIECALATMVSAAARHECRGAHTVVGVRASDRRSGRAERPQRRRVDEAHALVQRRQPPRLQAGEPEAANRRIDPAQGAHLLTMETEPTPSVVAALDSIGVPRPAKASLRTFRIYRYDPDNGAAPTMQTMQVELDGSERMLLDALMKLKAMDPSLSFRRSCREGVCGSDAMNINGKNGLACLTNMRTLKDPIVLKPLPGLPVIRDLIVDMTQFFKQYHSIKPYLVNDERPPEKERLQSPEEREELNGLYECILCACCSTACPSFWWNPDKFVGPAGLLQAYRFIADSRDAGDQRAPRQPRGSVPPVSLPHDHELRRRVPEEPEPDPRHRQDQGADGEARRLMDAAAAIDDRALSKLRWRCRRGLLENDLLIERFFARPAAISEADARGLYALMELADNDLLDLFLGRQKPPANLDRPEVRQVIEAVRATR